MNIQWHDAQNRSEHYKHKKEERYKELLEDINGADISCLTATDINHYVYELNSCNVREKLYTPNEVRSIMIETSGGNGFDAVNSFIDDETDSIFDFY